MTTDLKNTSKTRPKISVLGASYNHVNFLLPALQSILDQQGPSFEVILIDDASQDGTQNLLKNISDPRLHIILRESNQGICRTFNQAFSHARGEYIALMPGDDISLPGRLATQAAYLDANPDTVAVFSFMTPIDKAGKIIRDSTLRQAYASAPESREKILRMSFEGNNSLFAPTEMLRREALMAEPYFYDIRCSQGQDWEQHTRMAIKGDIAIIPKSLVHYRIHDTNASKASPKQAACLAIEHIFVLNDFLRITDINLFLRIFPELESVGTITTEQIPYWLARIAISIKRKDFVQWGMSLLADMLSTDAKALELERLTGFTLKEYYTLQASL